MMHFRFGTAINWRSGTTLRQKTMPNYDDNQTNIKNMVYTLLFN